MAPRPQNRGLSYMRRSNGKQELSLAMQLDWACATAAGLKVSMDASSADLAHMREHRLSSFKSLRLDDAISGADLDRPGFLSLIDDALRDRTISHIFIHKRDRFARPQDAMEMVSIEKNLRRAGITIVFSNCIAGPIDPSEPDIAQDIALLLEYYQSGDYLRLLAERVISAKTQLASSGYWTGGRAPYGFVRILVDSQGNELEELADGRKVRQAGCHVRVKPKDESKIRTWLLILDLKRKWGAKRIATFLNASNIPSPDAGRIRTDHGVPHVVSGKWNQSTILDLCRNPIIIGMMEFGRRSEGKHRRLGATGPRLLTDADRKPDSNDTRLINNPASIRIRRPAGFEGLYDPSQWNEIQDELDRRGKSQRGIPRARDLDKYLLSCRAVDMTDNCGSVLYGRTSGKRALYTCGRYLRTAGAECENNAVDAEALHRVVLNLLKQFLVTGNRRERLEQILRERAKQPSSVDAETVRAEELDELLSRKRKLVEDRSTAGRRLAVEPDDELSKIIRSEFERLTNELTILDFRIEALHQKPINVQSPDGELEAALSLLNRLDQILQSSSARDELRGVIEQLGIRIGLTFGSATKGKKRKVRRLVGGMIVFGDQELPVRLHGRDRIDGGHCGHNNDPDRSVDGNELPHRGGRQIERKTAGPVPKGSNPAVDFQNESHREGISSTKVSRGDWI